MPMGEWRASWGAGPVELEHSDQSATLRKGFQKNYADDRVAPRHWQDVNYALARNLIDVTNSKGMPAEA